MSVIEAVITILIGVVVMGVAYSFYEGTTKLGRKASGISAAAQVAAQFFYALEQDVANLQPQEKAEDTFNTEDGESVGTTPGTRRVYFTRRDPRKEYRLDFNTYDYFKKPYLGISVTYEAVWDDKLKVYKISRYVGEEPNVIQRTEFHGAWAKDVRFSRVKLRPPVPLPLGDGKDRGEPYLRVTLLLVGETDPEKVSSANKAKPVVLSTLFHIPRFGGGTSGGDLLSDAAITDQ
jgi:hypothetical protein